MEDLSVPYNVLRTAFTEREPEIRRLILPLNSLLIKSSDSLSSGAELEGGGGLVDDPGSDGGAG